MWTQTTIGFFSATQHRTNRDLLVIRARSKADLLNLQTRFHAAGFGKDVSPEGRDFAPFQNKGGSDYPWRIMASKQQYAAVMGNLIMDELDYGNFKDEVTRKQSRTRHDTYSRVWSVLLDIEREPGAQSRRTFSTDYRTSTPYRETVLPAWDQLDLEVADDVDEDGPTHDEHGTCLSCHHRHEYIDPTDVTCTNDCTECADMAAAVRAQSLR